MSGAEFLANARRWLAWVESVSAGTERMIEVARSKPTGLHQDGNLILDSEGQVWDPVWVPRRGYVKVTRPDLTSRYERTNDFIAQDERAYNGGPEPFEIGGRVFVAKGFDRPDEDWCWCVPPLGGMSTLDYYEGRRAYDEAGKRLGAALVKLSAEALEGWAGARAKGVSHDGRKRAAAHVDGDWASLTEAFGLPPHEDAHDPGSLLCQAHMLVDRAAGVSGRGYGW